MAERKKNSGRAPPFKKGQSKTPGSGRKKGTPNKSTVAVKEALQAAFDGIGGVGHLTKFAKASPEEFYKLWVKMLPQEVKNTVAMDPSVMAAIEEGRKRVAKPSGRD
jgi:hypothetical protein